MTDAVAAPSDAKSKERLVIGASSLGTMYIGPIGAASSC